MKLARQIVMVACAGLLLVAKANADDQQSEKPATVSAPPENKGGSRHSSVFQDKESASASTHTSPKKKRGALPSWLRMAAETQTKQPDWLSPLATTSGRLKQEFRYDIWDQPALQGNRTYQFGGGKGLELITNSRTQVLAGIPSYTFPTASHAPRGFGDLPLMLKIRIASAERDEGNFLLTFILAASAPTGSNRYGLGDAVLTPTLAFGKGWKKFDAQSTLGITLPTGSTAKLGRQVQWNTAFQCQAGWKLWPELEVNSTFYKTGFDAGAKQVFLTPGLGFGRVRLGKGFRFSSAAGMQIAVTKFHTYNHRWVFSERISF